VLGKLTLRDHDLAATAQAAAAAYRIDIDTQRARGSQYRRAYRKMPSLSEGMKTTSGSSVSTMMR